MMHEQNDLDIAYMAGMVAGRKRALKEAADRAVAFFGWTGLRGYRKDADDLRAAILADKQEPQQ